MSTIVEELDPFEARIAAGASGLLRAFNRAGVLSAADVHVARRLGRLGSEHDEGVLLAVALAVRAPRLGHVHVDLESIRDTAAVESENPVDLEALPWPDVEPWLAAVAASPLVADAGDADRTRPLRLERAWLYLDRYWSEEVAVADALRAMQGAPPTDVDEPSARRRRRAAVRFGGRRRPGPRRRRGGSAPVRGRRRRTGDRQDDDRRADRGAAVRAVAGPPAADRARRPDRQGRGTAAGSRPRRGGTARHLRRRARPAAGAVGDHDPPAARLPARQPQPLPPRSRTAAPA